jgi:hypothetical protein
MRLVIELCLARKKFRLTPDPDRKFDIYACAAYCLMTIANARRAGLTKAAFIDRYAFRFWIGSDKCGGHPGSGKGSRG